MFIKRDGPDYSTIGIPFEVKAEDIDEDGRFKGWASTFGGSPDAHGDVIVKGAFKETILMGGRNGNGIPMLYQHNSDKPIGIWEKLEEKEQGLYVEGKLILEVALAREAYELMKAGAIKNMSIGWDIARLDNGMRDPEAYEIVRKGDSYTRFLKKIVLWEISLVTFPANTNANITTVKAFEMCKTKRDYENVLREAGLTNNQAKHIVSKMDLREEDHKNQPNQDDLAECILAEFQRRNTQPTDF